MKVSFNSSHLAVPKTPISQEPPKISFEGILKTLSKSLSLPLNINQSMDKGLIGQAGKSFKDLLSIQTQLSKFHLTVELCSKAGESAAATARRFQQGG